MVQAEVRAPLDGEHRVLVVDDDADARETLREFLELHGYAVETAANGVEALRIAKADHPPCLVLLDLMMPWMTGWEFAAELQKIGRLSAVPVIVVSGVENTHANEMPQVVADVSKPVDLSRLKALLQRYC